LSGGIITVIVVGVTVTARTPTAAPTAAPTAPSPAEPSTRDRLIAAAIDVFVEQGYEQARVQDIARAAGLTTGAIYGNFRDKAELLLAAIANRSAVEVGTLLQAAESNPSRDSLVDLGERIAFRKHSRPLLLDAVVAARRDPALAGHLRKQIEERHTRFADLVDAGKGQHVIDENLDTDTVTRFCLTLAFGSIVVGTLGLPEPDRDQWVALIERLIDALAPTEETS
jgi:AcrR family transcriptional regulator